jgi:hypothetical protein
MMASDVHYIRQRINMGRVHRAKMVSRIDIIFGDRDIEVPACGAQHFYGWVPIQPFPGMKANYLCRRRECFGVKNLGEEEGNA